MTIKDINDMDKEYQDEPAESELLEWKATLSATIYNIHKKLLSDVDIENSQFTIYKTITVDAAIEDEAHKLALQKNDEWIKELKEKLPNDCDVELDADKILVR